MYANRADDSNSGGAQDRWDQLIGHIQDAVVEFELVDGEPIVRDVNAAFVDVFGYDPDEVVDEPLNEYIVPEWRTIEARVLDARTSSGDVNYRRVRRITADGLRDFLYRGIPYAGDEARIDGFAIYTDLTELNQHERQLQVLNRILRHNLRNRATVITGNMTRLLEQFDEQMTERTRIAATVERAAQELAHLADEATHLRRVVNGSNPDVTVVDCVPMLNALLREHRRAAPAAVIDADLPPSMEVMTAGGLDVALDSLVRNAIEHNAVDTPRVLVRVAAAESDGWVDVRVEDDGPLIPRAERDLVTGHAEITQTQHGLGLGLWLVKWATERSGGEMSFDRSDMGGNSVRLRLKRPG